MILIILLILIIILILINTKKPTRELKLKNLYNKEYHRYRIGDVYIWGKGPKYDRVKYHEENFPNSIATKYLNLLKEGESNNKDKLMRVINNEPKLDTSPEDNSFVLHMRVGDVFCRHNGNWMSSKLGVKGMINHYTKKDNPEWWRDILKFMNEKNLDKVYIIVGSHTPYCLLESEDFIMDRVNMFRKNGKDVVLRIGNTPDEDILWVRRAKYFKSTGGGYGKVLGIASQENGGVYKE
jgi:hypothetical protein